MRNAVAEQLAEWSEAGHDVGPAARAALTVAAHGVDVAHAQAVAGKAPGRAAVLAALGLSQLVREHRPAAPSDALDAVLASLLADENARSAGVTGHDD